VLSLLLPLPRCRSAAILTPGARRKLLLFLPDVGCVVLPATQREARPSPARWLAGSRLRPVAEVRRPARKKKRRRKKEKEKEKEKQKTKKINK